MERLKRRSDFQAAAQAAARGARASARAFVLQAHLRAEAGPPRVGLTVSKRVGNAVERNRVRRRLRELVRAAPAASLRTGHDYVLVGRPAALKARFGEMLQDFTAALQRVHVSAKVSVKSSRSGTGASGNQPPHRASSPGRRQRHEPGRNMANWHIPGAPLQADDTSIE